MPHTTPGVAANDADVAAGKTQIAVYDFDGTCISANSPVLLVFYLVKKGLLTYRESLPIVFWALRYKFRLPQNESSVRERVFAPFAGMPTEQADRFLRDFYDEEVERCWRAAADASMRADAQAGRFVMVVSATWQAIADRAREFHPFEAAVCTKMAVDAFGDYTCKVDGLPVEGDEKLSAISRFADKRFGAGNWEIAVAYGDHHSDRSLLAAAKQPFAVTPDKPLARTAERNGWPTLDWS